MSSVLARPGAPTIWLLPPTKSVISTWLMTSSWPMMSFLSSATICARPAFIRSASAMSSGDCRSTGWLRVELRSLIGYGLLLLSFGRADFARLQGDRGHQLLELGAVAGRLHALLEQAQRFDAPLEVAPFEIQRAYLGIARQVVAADGAERDDVGHAAVLAGGGRILAAVLVAIVVEQRV